MKTLITLTLTTLLSVPAFANQETNDVKQALDAHVAQHKVTVEQSMQEQINKDILSAVANFRLPLLQTSLEMLASTSKDDLNEVAEQADIE